MLLWVSKADPSNMMDFGGMADLLRKCTMDLGLDLCSIECHSYLQSNSDYPSVLLGSACCAVSIPDTSKCTWHAVLPMNGWIHMRTSQQVLVCVTFIQLWLCDEWVLMHSLTAWNLLLGSLSLLPAAPEQHKQNAAWLLQPSRHPPCLPFQTQTSALPGQ